MSPSSNDQPRSQYQRKAIYVFCSYAEKDKALRNDLELHLSAFKRSGLMTVWHNQEIDLGTEWEKQINTHLNTADIILLLLSPDFIASDYCYIQEMQHALERHRAGEAYVMPILLRHVHWQDTPLGKLPMLPSNSKPIMAWGDQDEALFHVADAIRQTALALRAQKERNHWVEEGKSLTEAGEYDKAEKAYAEVLRLFPDHLDNATIYRSRADLLRRLGRYQDAAEMYQKVISLNPEDLSPYHALGDVLAELARDKEALDAYKYAVQYDPQNVRLLLKHGDILSNLESYEEAVVAYNSALALDSTNIMLYISKGYALRCLHRYEDALDTYRQALKHDPVNVTLVVLEGTTLCELRQYEPAVDVYNRALALDATSAIAYVGKAFALSHLKRRDESQIAYKMADRFGHIFDLVPIHSRQTRRLGKAPINKETVGSENPLDSTQTTLKQAQANQKQTWACSLGHQNTQDTPFCDECGELKPIITTQYFCGSCGATNPREETFCSNCGVKLTWTCSLGHENPVDTLFCDDCGEPMTATLPCRSCRATNPRGEAYCYNCGASLS